MALYYLIARRLRQDVTDVNPLLVQIKTLRGNALPLQFWLKIFHQGLDWNEYKYKKLTWFFWFLSKSKLQWVTSKVTLRGSFQCMCPNVVYTSVNLKNEI